MGLRNNRFENPAGLVQFHWIRKVRAPRSGLIIQSYCRASWPDAQDRLKGTAEIVGKLAELADAVSQPAA
jgi:hypothetical protein